MTTSGNSPVPNDPVGLCRWCAHAHAIDHPRGAARYWRCTRAAEDPRLERYPRLPVQDCRAFIPSDRSVFTKGKSCAKLSHGDSGSVRREDMAATVLVVDDSPANLDILRQLLGRDQYTILVAGSGEDALGTAARHAQEIDLILLDVALGDTDGITVCQRLKIDPQTRDIPVVLISGVHTDDDSISRGLDVGAEGYLTKPISDNALRAWVRATLRISRLQRELAVQGGARAISEDELLRLISTLSHAVNNPLQALYAAADTLALEVPAESQQQALVGEIITQAERVAQIVAGASLRAQGQTSL